MGHIRTRIMKFKTFSCMKNILHIIIIYTLYIELILDLQFIYFK